MVQISPSMLACDFSRMAVEAEAMLAAGADMLHLDVMDGHFVPNISFGAPVIASLKKAVPAYFDVHLMISEPDKYLADFAKAGADSITFHVENQVDTAACIAEIRSYGISPALSAKPGTPAEALAPYLESLDMVLVMTVEPGFGGQSFLQQAAKKIGELCRMRNKLGLDFTIQVDGGIDPATAAIAAAYGANNLVAGSSLFKKDDYKQAVLELRSAANAAYNSSGK